MVRIITKIFVAAVLGLFCTYSFGQWTQNDNNIYYNSGYVGVGVDDPESALTIEKDAAVNGRVLLTLRNVSNSNYSNASIRIHAGNGTNNYTTLSFISHSYLNPTLSGYGYFDAEGNGLILRSKSETGVIKFFTGKPVSGDISDDFERMRIDATGNIGIATSTPDYKLDVNGTIRAKEIKVATGWSDFVFDTDYNLPTLSEVEQYIAQHSHLPEIPSAEEVEENGISVGEMNAKLLQKIEELTLYVIEQNKQIEELKNKVAELEKE